MPHAFIKALIGLGALVSGLLVFGLLALYLVNSAPVPKAPVGGVAFKGGLDNLALPLGPYELRLIGGEKPQFLIEKAGRPVFASVPGQSPIHVTANRLKASENRGMIRLKERRGAHCTDLTLASFSRHGNKAARGITLGGSIQCPDGLLEIWISLQSARSGEGSGALAFDIRLGEDASVRGYTSIALVGQSSKAERFYGFGAQMGRVDFKGTRFPLVVSEQGIGRGVEPLSTVLNWFYGGADGEWHSAYAPAPITLTSERRGVFLASYAPAIADLRETDRFVLSAQSTRLLGGFLGGEPLDMISDYTANVGRQRPLPLWVMEGAILGLQGGTADVLAKTTMLEEAGTPIAALWLQDWVGQRTTDFGKQLWWSWTLDETRYPQWQKMVADLAADGIKVLGYINPFLVDTTPWQDKTRIVRRNLFKEAREKGYLVKHADGSPYLLKNTSFEAGLLDLSNEAAQNWIMRVMKEEMVARGFSGWMADFGEGLPFDARLATSDAELFHNAYPDVWAHLNRIAITRAGLGDEALVFHRSGYFGAAGRAPAFWLGDQLVTWDSMDGLKSAIVGHQTSGFSGHGVTHADIGGYTTIKSPLVDYVRDKELLLRWAEFAAFSPIFRTHEGNMPFANIQAYSDGDTAEKFAKMARLYACLKPARATANEELRLKGWPISRHPALMYPDDKAMAQITHQQIMLGSDVMLAPVTDPGLKTASITLPEAGYVHLWSGRVYEKGTHTVDAPLGQPAAFIHQRSADFKALMACSPTKPQVLKP